jgi:hypothetical protein
MDMFMKNLKPLVHATHCVLKITVPSIKKSQIYEAIASYCGFKSYAAFQLADELQVTNKEQANRQCFERMLDIGFVAGEALLINQHTEKLWEEINTLNLDDIWDFYNNASYDEKLSSLDMLDALKSFMNTGNLEAKLIGLVVTTEVLAEHDENQDNRSGKYWHNKRLAGNSLNDLQKEVADNYLQTQYYREFLSFLRSDLFNSGPVILPSPLTLKNFCREFNVNTNKEWTSYFSEAPYLVIDAFEHIEHYRDSNNPLIPNDLFLDWYKTEVMQNPNKEMVADVIEKTGSCEEKWFWYYLGKLYDFDVTKDAHVAINADTGEEYDGYGPVSVGGYSGISLPEISESSKLEMQKLVTSFFSKSIK